MTASGYDATDGWSCQLADSEAFEFENGGFAPYRVHRDEATTESLASLGIPTGVPVVVIVGGARVESKIADRLSAVFLDAIAPAIALSGATVITGGTDAGVMHYAGRAMRKAHPDPCVVGIAPIGRVAYPVQPILPPHEMAYPEPNHSHFLLSSGNDWGDETQLMFEAASAISGDAPTLVILAGGGQMAAKELRQLAPLHWPHLVITGTGGIADSLGDDPSLVPLPQLETYPVDASLGALRQLVAWRLSNDDTVKELWHQFAAFDVVATRRQQIAKHVSMWMLSATTLLALLASTRGLMSATPETTGIALALATATFGILTVRPSVDRRWMQARLEAERLRSRIYSARTGNPSVDRLGNLQGIAAAISSLLSLGITPLASSSSLTLPPDFDQSQVAGGDTLVGSLDAPLYAEARLDHQIAYFSAVAERHRRRTMAFAIGASLMLVATFVVAVLTLLAAVS